jgi:hypothetical protein
MLPFPVTYLIWHVAGDRWTTGQMDSDGCKQSGGLALLPQSLNRIMAEVAQSLAAKIEKFRTRQLPLERLGGSVFRGAHKKLSQRFGPLDPRYSGFQQGVPAPGPPVVPLCPVAAPPRHVASRSGASRRPSCPDHGCPPARRRQQMQEKFDPLGYEDGSGNQATPETRWRRAGEVQELRPVDARGPRRGLTWRRPDSAARRALAPSAIAHQKGSLADFLGLFGTFWPGGGRSFADELLDPL